MLNELTGCKLKRNFQNSKQDYYSHHFIIFVPVQKA